MRKTLTWVALLALAVVFVNGCKASGEINPDSGKVSTEVKSTN